MDNFTKLNFKKNLRSEANSKLKNISSPQRSSVSQMVTAKLIENSIFADSVHIGCYFPIGNEIDTSAIITAIWQRGKQCYLPAIVSTNEMVFVEFCPRDTLVKKKYGAQEPLMIQSKIRAPRDLDLVIVPLLGFNDNLFRLGRGLGYYDKTFSFKKMDHQNPYLLGLGYENQKLHFTSDPWDVAMNSIIAI